MFTVYVIRSTVNGMYYVGFTDDIDRRMMEHNEGMSKFTRRGRPWTLMFTEQFETRREAMMREREIKKRKSRTYLERLIRGE